MVHLHPCRISVTHLSLWATSGWALNRYTTFALTTAPSNLARMASIFKYEGHVYDTMVAEYILAKARRWPLSLAAVAEKYGGVQKEKDLISPYFKEGKTFFDIPWDTIVEYGIADVIATEEVALEQLKAFGSSFEELFNDPNTNTEVVA